MTASAQGGGHVQLKLGAYVLNALAADEEHAVAQHLADCARCTADLAELLDVREILDRLDQQSISRLLDAAAQPAVPEVHSRPPHPNPAAGSAPRGGANVRPATAGRRWARPARVLVAAVALALAAGVGIGAWLAAREPIDIRLAGAQTDRQSGVSVSVTVIGTPAGARVDAFVEGLTVSEPYGLYAIGDRGESQAAASWIAHDDAQGVGGVVSIPIDRITAVVLFHADETLVTVRLRER